jgi:hypothetical protein
MVLDMGEMEERGFTNNVFLDKNLPRKIWIDGQEFWGSNGSINISQRVLDDLESLAIEAFLRKSDNSQGKLFLDKSLKKLNRRHPNEQPEEVWRKDIAGLVEKGVAAEDIAKAIFLRNKKQRTHSNLRSVLQEGEEKIVNTIRGGVLEYWPSVR